MNYTNTHISRDYGNMLIRRRILAVLSMDDDASATEGDMRKTEETHKLENTLVIPLKLSNCNNINIHNMSLITPKISSLSSVDKKEEMIDILLDLTVYFNRFPVISRVAIEEAIEKLYKIPDKEREDIIDAYWYRCLNKDEMISCLLTMPEFSKNIKITFKTPEYDSFSICNKIEKYMLRNGKLELHSAWDIERYPFGDTNERRLIRNVLISYMLGKMPKEVDKQNIYKNIISRFGEYAGDKHITKLNLNCIIEDNTKLFNLYKDDISESIRELLSYTNYVAAVL